MSEAPHAPNPTPLPEHASLEWLRKQAKRELKSLRETNPAAQLADAQFRLATQYGFSSWRALKAHIDGQTLEGQLFDAARHGRLDALKSLLDRHPEKLHARDKPYEWTLLHAAAAGGHLPIVELLIARGLDVNARERGDNTYPMHWAAAAGHLEVVRRLADEGGDVTGHGDDHELEVIGWATCWQPGPQREVAEFLVSRGARHHIFSAIAMDLADEVRRIVDADRTALQRRMSRNEVHQMPLHFAVRFNRPEMVSLLLELGADPLAVDGHGFTAAAYATTPDVDRRVMSAIAALTDAELISADRGKRRPRAGLMDVMAMLSLRNWEAAETLMRDVPGLITPGGAAFDGETQRRRRGRLAASSRRRSQRPLGALERRGDAAPSRRDDGTHRDDHAIAARGRRSACSRQRTRQQRDRLGRVLQTRRSRRAAQESTMTVPRHHLTTARRGWCHVR
jgi:ankyrin repeat protein